MEGNKVWPNGPSSVAVDDKAITLTPTDMQEDLTITINVDDDLLLWRAQLQDIP